MNARNKKAPCERGFRGERMMGLEPTTFCMASRRSSQLSYIREGRQYSRAQARPSRSDIVRATA
jgi:hypothetical protein